MKKILAFATIGLLLFASITLADMSKYISVQGILTDADGLLLPSGSYRLRFNIFTSATCPGAGPLWSRELMSVSVDDSGFFDVDLDFTGTTLGFNQEYWLEVEVWDTASSSYNTLCPHIRMSSVAYAFSANRLLPTTYPVSIDLTSYVGSVGVDWDVCLKSPSGENCVLSVCYNS